MPLRERIKRVFKSSSPNSSLSKTPTNKSSTNGKNSPAPDGGRWPSNVYAPGEPMPRPKYRAPVKKEHKEKLEAFSFSSAWRRRSYISEYSPMGSRMPSRRGSLLSRKSIGGKSARRGSIGDNKSTRGSIDARSHNGDNTGTGGQVKGRHAARATRLSAEIEAEGDDDVANGTYLNFLAILPLDSCPMLTRPKSVSPASIQEIEQTTLTKACLKKMATENPTTNP